MLARRLATAAGLIVLAIAVTVGAAAQLASGGPIDPPDDGSAEHAALQANWNRCLEVDRLLEGPRAGQQAYFVYGLRAGEHGYGLVPAEGFTTAQIAAYRKVHFHEIEPESEAKGESR